MAKGLKKDALLILKLISVIGWKIVQHVIGGNLVTLVGWIGQTMDQVQQFFHYGSWQMTAARSALAPSQGHRYIDTTDTNRQSPADKAPRARRETTFYGKCEASRHSDRGQGNPFGWRGAWNAQATAGGLRPTLRRARHLQPRTLWFQWVPAARGAHS